MGLDEERGSGFLFYESARSGRRLRAHFSLLLSVDGFRLALKDERGDHLPGGVIAARRGGLNTTDFFLELLAPDLTTEAPVDLDLAS
jgi:hypothetical protein